MRLMWIDRTDSTQLPPLPSPGFPTVFVCSFISYSVTMLWKRNVYGAACEVELLILR